MGRLAQEAQEFADRLAEEARDSNVRIALQLFAGIDFGAMLRGSAQDHQQILPRIQRALMRERLRGNAGHWSYDLNRHIALKQAMDYLQGGERRVKMATAVPVNTAAAKPWSNRSFKQR